MLVTHIGLKLQADLLALGQFVGGPLAIGVFQRKRIRGRGVAGFSQHQIAIIGADDNLPALLGYARHHHIGSSMVGIVNRTDHKRALEGAVSVDAGHVQQIAVHVLEAKIQLRAVVGIMSRNGAAQGSLHTGCAVQLIRMQFVPHRLVGVDAAFLERQRRTNPRNIRRIVAASDDNIDGLGHGMALPVIDGENNVVGLLLALGKAVRGAVGILLEGVGVRKGNVAAAA